MTKFKDQPSMYSLVDKPRKISEDHYLLRIKSVSNESAPGQFITIRASKLTDPLLRRPFSIFNHQENLIDIVVKNVGKCTNILAGYSNDTIDMQGPMGKGFTTIERGKALLVGGGVGNAPLFYLAKKLKDLGNEITFIYGMQSKKYIFQIEQFKNFTNKFSVTTDDGTEGEKGFTTDLAEKFLQNNGYDMIYSCGPAIMMKRLVDITENIPIEVSVENYFGCGSGLCYGCSIKTKNGIKRACTEGPVFNGREINWESMQN